MDRIYWVIVRILCGMGCVYQTYKLSSIYFSYETTTFVRYESDGEKTLPAITVCYNKYLQLKDEFKKKIAHFDNNKAIFKKLNNLTIAEQFQSMEKEPRMLKNCMNAGGKNCTSIANLTKSIEYNFYCFTILSQLNGEPDDSY